MRLSSSGQPELVVAIGRVKDTIRELDHPWSLQLEGAQAQRFNKLLAAVFTAAHGGTPRLHSVPQATAQRLDRALSHMSNGMIESELPKAFPGARAVIVNLGGRGGGSPNLGDGLDVLSRAASDLRGSRDLSVYTLQGIGEVLMVCADRSVDLGEVAAFLEEHEPQWEFKACGGEAAVAEADLKRQHEDREFDPGIE